LKFSVFLKTTLLSTVLLSSTLLNIHTIRLILKEHQEQQKTQMAWLKKRMDSIPSRSTHAASPVLYRTKNGDKYHYDPHCSNHEYFVCSQQDIQMLGLKPCKKCVK
jgi:hypothetical protein